MKEARWNITLLLLFSVFLQTFPGISTQAGKYDHLDIITLAVHILNDLLSSRWFLQVLLLDLVLDQLVTLVLTMLLYCLSLSQSDSGLRLFTTLVIFVVHTYVTSGELISESNNYIKPSHITLLHSI